jgi:phytanoyl-CoA hydroxylase
MASASSSVVHGRWQLTETNITQFWRQGYIWLRGFASKDEVARMRTEMAEMIDVWELPDRGAPGMAAFRASLSLRNGAADGESDHLFLLDSATKASFFVEPGAVDADAGTLRPGVSKRQAVRKVAHGLHLLPGAFQDFSTSAKVAATTMALGLRQPAVVQSLYRLAPPLSAGVDRHQDSTMLYTEPPTCLGLWLALEDTDETNGCLRVREGSHTEPIRERLVRRPGKNGTGLRLLFEKFNSGNEVPAADEAFRPLKASSGDLVIMHGSLEHVSFAGVAPDRSRESFQLHLVDAEAKWSPENWLQYPSDLPFTKLAPPGLSSSVEL